MPRNRYTSKLIKFKLINIIILNRFLIWINSFRSNFTNLLPHIFLNFSQIISSFQKRFKLLIKILNLWRLKINLLFRQISSNIPNQTLLIRIFRREIRTCSLRILRRHHKLCLNPLFDPYLSSPWLVNTLQNFGIILRLQIFLLAFFKFILLDIRISYYFLIFLILFRVELVWNCFPVL